MAQRGPKPKATVIHLVKNKPGHRPLPKDEPVAKGPLGLRPHYLKGRSTGLWNEVSKMAWWLGDVDRYKLGVWCELQVMVENGLTKMTATLVVQWRVLGSELGLDPATRSRMDGLGKYGQHPEPPTAPGTDPYFDD